MFLCPVSDILVVAGTAGQVIVLQMEREQRELDIKVRSITLWLVSALFILSFDKMLVSPQLTFTVVT